MSEPIDNTVQEWVSTWPKHTLTDYEKTLIVGNLNGFYTWLKRARLTTQLATPLSAKPTTREITKVDKLNLPLSVQAHDAFHSKLVDAEGNVLAFMPKETAAQLVAMAEDAKRLDLALMGETARVSELEHALSVIWADAHWINLDVLEKMGNTPMLIEVIQNIRKWSGKHKAALAAGGDSDQSKTASQ